MPSLQTPTVSGIRIYPVKSCHSVQLEESEVGNLGLVNDRRFLFIEEATNRFITQRKYASMALVRPLVDMVQKTLTLTSHDDEQPPLVLPLYPDTKLMQQRTVKLWKDTLTAYDMGDAAGEWLETFFRRHRSHDVTNNHNPDDPVDLEQPIPRLRLVTLEDPQQEGSHYSRPAHQALPGTHSPFTDWSPVSFGFEASLDALNQGLLARDISQGNIIGMDRFRNNVDIAGTLPWEEDTWLVAKIGEVTFYLIRPIGRCTVPGVDQDSGVKDTWGGPLSYLKEKRSFSEKPNDGCFCVDVVPLTSGTIRVGDKVEVLERIPAGKEPKPLVKKNLE
ncbi:MOSC N-terminal beta barrel domain-containing protein [Halteromyces radiatus]|uniref:MOSC N-terminal beta barrel domain-containing protein n=1 Tax=Halteromyces radiatus TaxID=101107 RepID=UPI002220BDE9|nr:MOSC N-terminal beta barrel domain-containing protein [Halteromyces radiatus]KAI8086372.1 MOSC N-terminal beta barrel domain-containing protein [Halteromyces radiatus]